MSQPPQPPTNQAKVKVFDSTMIVSGLLLLIALFAWTTWIHPYLNPPPPTPTPVPVTAQPPAPNPPVNTPTVNPAQPLPPGVAGPVLPAAPTGAPQHPDADLDAGAPAQDLEIETQGGRVKALISTVGGALRFYEIAEPKPLPDDEPRIVLLDALVRQPYAMMSLALREVKYRAPGANDWRTIPEFDRRTYRIVPVNGSNIETGSYHGATAKMVTLESRTPQFTVRRKFIFYEDFNGRQPDHVDTELQFIAAPNVNLEIEYKLRGPAGILPDGPKMEPVSHYSLNMGRVFTWHASQGAADVRKLTQAELIEFADRNSSENLTFGELNLWTGVQNRFFSAVLIPYDPRQDTAHPQLSYTFYAEPLRAEWLYQDPLNPRYGGGGDPNIRILESETGVIRGRLLSAAQPVSDQYGLYVGPSAYAQLRDYDAMLPVQPVGLAPGQTLELDQNIEYSSMRWIDMLSRALVWFLGNVNSMVGSYGLSLILLTVLVKLAMFPVSKKTIVSMEKQKLLQPYMLALKKLYEGKEDQASKQKFSQEMMALYRMNNANPLGSCLPMLVTIPIFLALYNAFWANYDMRHVGYLGFIRDLCEPDRIFPIYLDRIWNWLPHWFNLMPTLYVVLNYVQMALAPQVQADPTQQQMKVMTKFMPLMMFVFFYSMPSGLVLYFVASLVYGILENRLIRRYFYKPVPVEAPAHLKKLAEKMASESQAAAQASGLSLAARG